MTLISGTLLWLLHGFHLFAGLQGMCICPGLVLGCLLVIQPLQVCSSCLCWISSNHTYLARTTSQCCCCKSPGCGSVSPRNTLSITVRLWQSVCCVFPVCVFPLLPLPHLLLPCVCPVGVSAAAAEWRTCSSSAHQLQAYINLVSPQLWCQIIPSLWKPPELLCSVFRPPACLLVSLPANLPVGPPRLHKLSETYLLK